MRGILRYDTRTRERYRRILYQHAEPMDASISFRGEELGRIKEWIYPGIR